MRDRDGRDEARAEIRPGIRRLVRLALRRPERARDEMDDEIRLHLQLRAERLVRDGMSPDDARREAERRFGLLDGSLLDSAARREDHMRWHELLSGMRHGLTVMLRGMRRSPAFVVTAVTCIALGVGANAAAYSVFEELLLSELPVHEPERLVNLGAPGPKPGNDQCTKSGTCEEVFSFPMFRDLERAPNTGLSGIAAHRLFIASVAHDGQAAQGDGEFVSGGYFKVLGLAPALGRLIGPADDVSPGAHPVAVVSHAYWTSHLGADPSAIGRTIQVNGRTLTIVGVAPRGFEGTTLGVRTWLYVPVLMSSEVDPFFGPHTELTDRRRYWAYVFGRLAPGTSIERARTALAAVYRPILADIEAPLHKGMSDQTMKRFLAREVSVTDGRHGQTTLRDATRMPLVFLFAITGLVVLIACANIANLLMARGAARATEIAVRLSLGASRRQLVAQLLTESVLLALLGGLASLAVAWGTLRLIGSFLPAVSVGFGEELALELRPSVLAFAGIVSLATGVLFGLFPALHATRSDLIASIRAGAGQIQGGHRTAARFRTSLVTAQFALAMALLGCAGLFVKSLRNIGRVDLGMQTEQVIQFALLPEFNGYDGPRTQALFERAEEQLAALPGIVAASASGVPLMTNSSSGGNVRVEGFERGPDTDANTRMNWVGPGFFRSLGIGMIAGREFTLADRLGAPRVAIVNEAFARKFGLGRNAVGKRVANDDSSASAALNIEIVGLVRDAGYSGVKGQVPPVMFTPWRQDSVITAAAFYVRTTLPAGPAMRSIRAAVSRLDPALPMPMLKPMSQQVRESVYLDRMIGTLSAGFAALATLLAAVGLYGMLAYTVAQRTRELGVRMALGADGGRVRAIVLRQVAQMAAIGGVIGLAAALALGKAAQSMLFGLDGRDPAVLASAALVLGVVALAAGWIPAWRASRLSPVMALRHD